MKIALVTDSTWPYMRGGKEIRTHHIVNELEARGMDFTVYTMASWGSAPAPPHTVGICPGRPAYRGSRRSILSSLIFALACFRLLFRKFDVLEADHMPYLHLFTLWLVCLLKRKPLVVTWHEVWSYSYWREYFGVGGIVAYLIERLAELLPSQIICASEQSAELLRRRGVKPERIHVVRAGVDHHSVRSRREKLSKDISVLFIGRLVRHKRVDLLIDAVSLLRKNGVSCRLTILGDGPELQRLRERADALGMTNHDTIFQTNLPDGPGRDSIVDEATVFVSPSEREGFGIAVAEALACGLPVIVSDHPDNHAQNLLIGVPATSTFTNGDAHDLAAKILSLQTSLPRTLEIRTRFLGRHPDLTWEYCATLFSRVLRVAVQTSRSTELWNSPTYISRQDSKRIEKRAIPALRNRKARRARHPNSRGLAGRTRLLLQNLVPYSAQLFGGGMRRARSFSFARRTSTRSTIKSMLISLPNINSRIRWLKEFSVAVTSSPSSLRRFFTIERWWARTWVWVLVAAIAIVVYGKFTPESAFGGSNLLIETITLFVLFVLPGLSLLNAIGMRAETRAIFFCFAIGISAIEIMVLGAFASYALPLFGVSRPLEYPWVAVILAFQIAFCGLLAENKGRDPFGGIVSGQLRGNAFFLLCWLALPIGVYFVERGLTEFGSEMPVLWLAMLVVGSVVLIPLVISCQRTKFNVEWPIFIISLSMLWFTSLRGEWVSGFDIQTEIGIVDTTIQNGFWHVPTDGSAYGSMLSLTVLPGVINEVTGLSSLMILKFVFPIFGALSMAVLASKISRISSPSVAVLLVGLLFLQNQSYFQELPALARQEISFFLFALLIIVFADRKLSRVHAQFLVIAFAAGISISHYTTSYLTAGLILLAYFSNLAIRFFKSRRSGEQSPKPIATLFVSLSAMLTSWLWNGFLTKSTSEVFKVLDFINTHGLNVLPSGNDDSKNLVEIWLNGSATAAEFTPSEIISQAANDREEIWTWMLIDERSHHWLPDLVESGGVPSLVDHDTSRMISTIAGISTQLILLMVVAFGLIFVFKSISRRYRDSQIAAHGSEMVGWFLVAILAAGLLRLSGSLAVFYSPNRVAIQLAVVFAIPIALAVNSVSRTIRRSWHVGAVVIFAIAASLHWNFLTLITGGQMPPWSSSTSQPSAQQVPSVGDIYAAVWMAENIGHRELVCADIYAANFISSQDGRARFNVFPSSLPFMVDQRGYVFESTHNLKLDYGFDKFRGTTYAYIFPSDFYHSTRMTLYSSETDRVLR